MSRGGIQVHRRIPLGVGIVLVVGLLAAGVAQSRPSAGTINIGWVGDKSGPTASSQLPALHGLESYIQYINGKGGVNGNTINLVEKDDQYSPTNELSAVKSLISDSHVPVITGLGQSTGFASVLPILSQNKVIGLPYQTVLKAASYPFQPYIFAGTCSYGDQAYIAAAYGLKRLHKKSYAGVTIGIPVIGVASGQEWTEAVTAAVKKLGATNIVNETLPPTLVSADVQIQDMQSKGVNLVFLHEGIGAAIIYAGAAAKYGFDVPTLMSSGATSEATFTVSPYSVSKDFLGTQCADPPYVANTPQGKLISTVAKQQGANADDLRQTGYSQGWVAGMILVQALKNAKGDYSSQGIKKGLEAIRKLETGVTPPISYALKCHLGWSTTRPYTYNYKTKGLAPVGTWAQWTPFDPHPYAAPGTCGVARGAAG